MFKKKGYLHVHNNFIRLVNLFGTKIDCQNVLLNLLLIMTKISKTLNHKSNQPFI